MTEFVDHLHEHFVDPVVIERARYMPPARPGYSTEIKAGVARRFTAFPMAACGRRV